MTNLARTGVQKGEGSRLGMRASMWVSNSGRSSHIRKLCYALGVRTGIADLDLENIPQTRTISG